MYRDGVELIAHADINDDGQTVTVKVPELENPKTGDERNKKALTSVMSVSALGAVSLAYYLLKKKKNNKEEK